MTRSPLASFALAIVALIVVSAAVAAQGASAPAEGSFFASSLHYANRGIEFIYSKEQGGVERLTGVPFKDTGCGDEKCHAEIKRSVSLTPWLGGCNLEPSEEQSPIHELPIDFC